MQMHTAAVAVHRSAAAPLAGATACQPSLISPVVLAGSVHLIETGTIVAIGLALAMLNIGADADNLASIAITSIIAALSTSRLAWVARLYSLTALLNPVRSLARLIGCGALVAAAVATAMHIPMLAGELTTVWLGAWLGACVVGLSAIRFAVAARARCWSRSGRLNRRAVIYGSGLTCAALVQAIEADRDTDIRICGIFDDRGEQRAGTETAGHPNRGGLEELLRFARSSRADLVLLALPMSAEDRLMDLLEKLWVLPADIRLAASASRLKLARRAYDYAGNVALVALVDRPITDWGLIAKAAFDKSIAALSLIVLAPLMLLIAHAIRMATRGTAR